MITTWLIILALILLGLGFMLVEMLLLPGVTFGAVLSACSFVGATYLAYTSLGSMQGLSVIIASLALVFITVFWALRTGVWGRVALKEQLSGVTSPSPEEMVPMGERGVAMSRLAPMGRAKFGHTIIEAKSQEEFIDPKSAVEVVGYENSAVIVKKVN